MNSTLVFIFLASFQLVFAEICEDGVNNLITVDSYGDEELPITVRNVSLLVYDEHMKPSCHNGNVNIVMPGYFVITGGEVEVREDFDVVNDGLVSLSMTYDDFLVCQNGEASFFFMPNKFCNFEISSLVPTDVLQTLQRNGTHTLQELQEKNNFNATLAIPESPSFLGVSLIDALEGIYLVKISLTSENKKIAEFTFPSDNKPFQLGVKGGDPNVS